MSLEDVIVLASFQSRRARREDSDVVEKFLERMTKRFQSRRARREDSDRSYAMVVPRRGLRSFQSRRARREDSDPLPPSVWSKSKSRVKCFNLDAREGKILTAETCRAGHGNNPTWVSISTR